MRRITVLIAVAALAVLANVAVAGDYHVGRTLICSDCHVAHASMKHGYATDADTTGIGTTPYEKLLRGETVNNACLGCHDGKAGIPDVLQAATDVLPNGRSAGALNVPNGGSHGAAQVSPYSQGDGHTLWSTDTPPGYVAPADPDPMLVGTEGLECTSCHGAHGNKYFRNMMGAPTTSTATYFNDAWKGTEVTYEITPTPTQPAAVWVLEKSAHGYDNDNVQYLEKDGGASQTSEYGKWCATCHKNFHGGETAGSPTWDGTDFVRHPTAGVDLAASSWANTDPKHRLKVMSATGGWAAAAASAPADMTPSCFTCHKSHGNANKFGLVFVLPASGSSAPAGSPAALIDPTRLASMGEEGDGGEYRDMCRNCHGMGRWPAGNPTNILP
jgi:hypothetical protein